MSAARRSAQERPRLQRLLDRLAAVIAISLVAVSGGLLAELNQQAQAQARVAAFVDSPSAPG